MKLFIRLIHISFLLILVVLTGCPTTEEISKTDSDTLLNKGIKHLDYCRFDKAISDFTKAIEINPSAEAYNKRGNAYELKARFIFDTGISVTDRSPHAEVYYRVNPHLDKAISDFNKAIELNPEYPEAYASRGPLYSLKGQSDKAKADRNKAMQILYWRAISYELKGQYEKACIDYRTACLWLGYKAACREFNILEEKSFCWIEHGYELGKGWCGGENKELSKRWLLETVIRFSER